MKRDFNSLLEQIDNANSSLFLRFISGLIWALILAAFFFCCAFLAYVFR